MNTRSFLTITAAGLMVAAPALAQVSATAVTDLNLRAGPAGNQQILAVIPANGAVTVEGCLEAANWCQVTYEGTQGWAFGEYLNATMQDQQVVVIESREPLQVVTIAPDAVTTGTEAADTAVGAGAGAAVAAALIGGPAAILAGAALGASIADDDPAVAYVRSNPVDPVYLDGEVVVGAGIPEGVNIIPVPETEFSYATINGVPVLVNQDRSIVRIIRD